MSLLFCLLTLPEYTLQKKLLSQEQTCICLSEDFTLLDWSMHIMADRYSLVGWHETNLYYCILSQLFNLPATMKLISFTFFNFQHIACYVSLGDCGRK